MLDNMKTLKKVVGVKQSLKALENGSVKLVYIARDADPRIVSSIVEFCRKDSVELIYEDSMKQLGKSCGIDVGAAVVSILK